MNELEKLTRAVESLKHSPGWDWNSFVSTLIATLVGAAAAGAVTIWVLRRQREDQYRGQLASSARSTLEAVLAYAAVRYGARLRANDIEPLGDRILGEVSMLDALAADDDRKVTAAIKDLASSITSAPLTISQPQPLAILANALSELVARRAPVSKQLTTINEANEDVRRVTRASASS